jgi:hypothetical protein
LTATEFSATDKGSTAGGYPASVAAIDKLPATAAFGNFAFKLKNQFSHRENFSQVL